MPTIYIKHASLAYQPQIIFANLSLTIPANQCVALLGPSGVGKSSLLKMLAGLTPAVCGEIYADNALAIPPQIAYMAQTDLLLPWMNVLSNSMLGAKLRGTINASIKHKAISLLTELGLHQALHLYPAELSGGMRQRVALARTLMEDKDIVLMDEPFSALDALTRYKLQNLASEKLRNKTVFFITHDPSEALRLANQIYIMQGEPASLTLAASLASSAPRDLSDPELGRLQAHLYQQLTAGSSL